MTLFRECREEKQSAVTLQLCCSGDEGCRFEDESGRSSEKHRPIRLNSSIFKKTQKKAILLT